ncbi:YezD family protein [Alkalihalobacillus macyae]|nr:YezD family protein [Alkalihalobacillus macyae]MDP4550286.1 YezD family protein [Alkalihalobacillus macyae]
MKKEQNFSDVAVRIEHMLSTLKFGSITLVVQDGKVIQLERQEKERLD